MWRIVPVILVLTACETPRENVSDVPVPREHVVKLSTEDMERNDCPFDRFAFRWLQNAVYDRPITKDNPLTEAEMNECFSRYRYSMPTYAEWSPPFDVNRDNMIDADEYERARALYLKFYD